MFMFTGDHYPMESIPQGYCLIVNIAHFLQHDDRPGSDVDAVKLHSLFEDVLNFVVTRVDDPTLPQLQQALTKFFQMDHSAYDAFFIIILSHGDPGDVIYTSDSQSIKISEISDHFTASNCPTLANKPKVFIVQACRGSEQNKPVIVSQVSNLDTTQSHEVLHDLSDELDSDKVSHDGGGGSSSDAKTNQTIPDKKDFYYAFATIDDHEALRHRRDGSWFINEFVVAVKQFAHKYGHVYLQELMLKVTERLSKYNHEKRMQVCEVKSSITKKILLSVNTKSSFSLPPSEASSLHSLTSSEHSVEEVKYRQLRGTRQLSGRPSSASELVVGTPPMSLRNKTFGNQPERWSFHSSTSSPHIRRNLTPPAGKTMIVPSISPVTLRHHRHSHPLSRSSKASSIASESSFPPILCRLSVVLITYYFIYYF